MKRTSEALGAHVKLNYGKALPANRRNPKGKFPVYGANGIKDRSDEYLVEGPGIIVGRKGSAGVVNRVEGHFWPLDVTYFVSFDDSAWLPDYLFHYLRLLNLPRLARGVKPGINREDVYALQVSRPPVEQQVEILDKLRVVEARIDSLRLNLARQTSHVEEMWVQSLKTMIGSGNDPQ